MSNLKKRTRVSELLCGDLRCFRVWGILVYGVFCLSLQGIASSTPSDQCIMGPYHVLTQPCKVQIIIVSIKQGLRLRDIDLLEFTQLTRGGAER